MYICYVLLDFEATCNKDHQISMQEIIQVPSVMVCGSTMSVLSTFNEYVRPVHNPTLTPFCSSLTGIQQSTVDAADTFVGVFKRWHKWLFSCKPKDALLVFVTWGNWDLMYMLHVQCAISSITVPTFLHRWFNYKAFVNYTFGIHPKQSLLTILESYGIEFVGSPHNGMDDCMSMLKLMQVLNKTVRLEYTDISFTRYSTKGHLKWKSILKNWL